MLKKTFFSIILFQQITAAELLQDDAKLPKCQLANIFAFDANQSKVLLGTGSIVTLKGNQYCLTAAHVVRIAEGMQQIVCIHNILHPHKSILAIDSDSFSIDKSYISVTDDQGFIPSCCALRHDAAVKLFEGQSSEALGVVTKKDQELIKANINALTFCMPATFSNSSSFLGYAYIDERAIKFTDVNMAFVFSGKDCEVRNGTLEAPLCLDSGNSGSPLVILSADKDREDLQHLIDKVAGIASSRLSCDVVRSAMIRFVPAMCFMGATVASYKYGWRKNSYVFGALSAWFSFCSACYTVAWGHGCFKKNGKPTLSRIWLVDEESLYAILNQTDLILS